MLLPVCTEIPDVIETPNQRTWVKMIVRDGQFRLTVGDTDYVLSQHVEGGLDLEVVRHSERDQMTFEELET